MASNLGTVFVELSLDDKTYKEKLSQIQPGMEATAKGLETSWRSLGVKTNQYFDDSRRAAENAYSLIQKSGKYAADEILRAEEAKNAKLNQLNEQQFGKQTTFIESIKTHYVAAAAVIYAAYATINKAWDLAKVGAEYEEQRGILTNLGAKYQTTADEIVSAMQRASDYQISKANLMSVSLAGLAKGLNPEQLTNLADAARILGDAVGKDATTALRELTEALESGRAKGLKNYLGTTLDLKGAFGDLEEKMTAAEKTQAMYSVTMIAATGLQKQQKGEVSGTADAMERMTANYENAKLAAGSFFAGVIGGAYNLYQTRSFMSMAEIVESLYTKAGGKLKDVGAAATTNAVSTEDPLKPYKDQIASLKQLLQARNDDTEATKKAAAEREAATKTTIEETRKAAYELEGIGKDAYDKEISRIDSEALKKSQAGVAAVTIAKWYTSKITLAEANQTEATKKLQDKSTKEYLDSIDREMEAEDERTRKLWEEDKKRTENRVKAERDIYKDMRGYEGEYFASTKALIDSQAAAYRQLGISEVAIAQWTAEEVQKAELIKLQASTDWIDGVKAGLIELERQQTTWGKTSYAVTKQFTRDASAELSQNFFKLFKGKFSEISFDWNKLLDGMVSKFSDKLADMVVEAAAKEVLLYFKTSWTEGGANVLGIVNKVLGLADKYFSSDTGSGGGGTTGVGVEGGDWTGVAGSYRGGFIKGYASGGDSPSNDTVPAWLSPGEYVVPRSQIAAMGQGGDTMIAHINASEARLLKSLGGKGTINERTGLPQFWGFNDFAGTFSGGLSDLVQGDWETSLMRWQDNPLVNTSEDFLAYTSGHMAIMRFMKEAGVVSQDDYLAAKNYTNEIAHLIGSYYAMAGMGLASPVSSAGDIAKSVAVSYAKKYAINALLGFLLGKPEEGQMTTTYEGANDGGMLGSLQGMMKDIAPQRSGFAFSARDGLDYVPYDNFPILAHRGERVQTKAEADQTRGGDAMTITIPVILNGREIATAIYKGSRRGQKFIHERGITGV